MIYLFIYFLISFMVSSVSLVWEPLTSYNTKITSGNVELFKPKLTDNMFLLFLLCTLMNNKLESPILILRDYSKRFISASRKNESTRKNLHSHGHSSYENKADINATNGLHACTCLIFQMGLP